MWGLIFVVTSDHRRLPKPAELQLKRSVSGHLRQLETCEVEFLVKNPSDSRIQVTLEDDLPLSFEASGRVLGAAEPKTEASFGYKAVPMQRGKVSFGAAHLRYESPLRLAQRWAVFDLQQETRVLPNIGRSKERRAALLRSRQIEMQMRLAKLRGQGREFESLREFQTGDEMRNVCWTATARRSKLVTTQRQMERSQTVWAVLDCGRLMRARVGDRSKLDFAAEAAVLLAQVSDHGGDSSALLAYGERLQQRILPGRGNQHLHSVLESAALVQEEASEADHLMAVGALSFLQKRRSLVVWITDLADLAMTPEVVTAVLQAARRHLVVLAVIGQPDITEILAKAPKGPQGSFLYAAATEVTSRRELMLSRLRARGVHALEINASNLAISVLNKYLEVKQKNLI
jgi:uncharacterized protein (DUF58 family)